MRLLDLPDTAKAFVCRHVFEDARPVQGVSFKGFISATCGEPDHDAKDAVSIALGDLLGRCELAGLDISSGEEAFLTDTGWKTGLVNDRWARERGDMTK